MDMLSMPGPQLPLGQDAQTLGQARVQDPRAIDNVATGFEELFLSMLLKEMRETLEPGVMLGEDQSDVLGGLFDMFMAQHLAKTRALGIADMVKKQLTTWRSAIRNPR